MKVLTLIRHGKSSWADPSLSDWERPLNNRGKKDSLLIGYRLKELNMIPDKIVSSSAKRAYDTAKRIAECIDYSESDIGITDNIYAAGFQGLFEIFKNLKDDWNHVFMFGHNPYFTEIADIYSSSRILNLPTTGLCEITFDCEKWADISIKTGKSTYFLTPKMLKK